jgi:hypothetical protein
MAVCDSVPGMLNSSRVLPPTVIAAAPAAMTISSHAARTRRWC